MLPALQAGLSALKTPQSYQGGCNREDPLHLKVSGCALRRLCIVYELQPKVLISKS